jgi:hypothetical protein
MFVCCIRCNLLGGWPNTIYTYISILSSMPVLFLIGIFPLGGTLLRSRLRHFAMSNKVVGLILDEVTVFSELTQSF